MKARFLFAIFLNLMLLPTSAFPAILEAASTLATIESIRSVINDSIDTASNRGDYLSFKAGTELKGVIDSWEKANSKLLTETFNKLDEQQQRFFRDADKIATRLKAAATDQLETTMQIGELVNQTIADIKFWDGKAAILRSSPVVIHPALAQEINITIRGISLDTANPRLRMTSTKQEFKRVDLKRQEVIFSMPKDIFTFHADKATRLQLEVIYDIPKDGFFNIALGKKEEVVIPLSLMQLPAKLGDYRVSITTEEATRLSQFKEREFSYSHGGNSESCDIQQQAPSNDFLINIDSIRPYARPNPDAGKQIKVFGATITMPSVLPAERGRGGSWRVESSSAHGFAIKLCAKRWYGPGVDSGPGFKHIYLRWEEYRDISHNASSFFKEGSLAWVSDESMTLPANTKSINVSIRTFNGLTKEATYSRLEDFFEIDFNSATKQLIIRPRIPSAIRQL